ncbi:hypothetical protein KR032_007012 [Drosophila birchii]|nr:hypothetical protein KR032_007012 [Drosophila birchii]
MKVIKKNFSHIRKKVEFTGEVASMTLDMYYKKNVKPHLGQKLKALPPKWRQHFQRTHYFGPKYWARRSPAYLEQAERLTDLRRRIREINETIDYKIQIDIQHKLLNQLKADLAHLEAFKKTVNINRAPPEPQHQSLVLMVGEEILYDEEYKLDPIWQ